MTTTPSTSTKNTNGSSVSDWLGLPRAKRASKLNRLLHALSGQDLQETFEVFGTRYTLRTLSPEAERWAANHTQGSTPLQIGRNQMAPQVAAAIVAIDGDPVTDLFTLPDDADRELRALLKESHEALTDWLRREVLLFLTEDGGQMDLIRELWGHLARMSEQRKSALEALAPLSEGGSAPTSETPNSGKSEPTSSPGKESSSPTPPSLG